MKKLALALALALVPVVGVSADTDKTEPTTDTKVEDKKVEEKKEETAEKPVDKKEEKAAEEKGQPAEQKDNKAGDKDKSANKNKETDNGKIDTNKDITEIIYNGKTYKPLAYLSSYTPRDSEIANDELTIKSGRDNNEMVTVSHGRETNTLDVQDGSMPFVVIFANEDYDQSKIPAQVYNATYTIKAIDQASGKVDLQLEDQDTIFYAYPKENYTYHSDLPGYAKGTLKVGDKIKAWGVAPTNGSDTESYVEIYKYEKLAQELVEDNIHPNKKLADTVFKNIIQSNSAKLLMDINPKAVKPFKASLDSTINESKELINTAYKKILAKDTLEKGDEDKAIVEILRLKYDKAIATESHERLALSVYNNLIRKEALQTLQAKAPKSTAHKKDAIEKEIKNSEELVNLAFETLK